MESVIGFDLGRDWIKILQLTPGKKILRFGKIHIPEEADQAKLPDVVVDRINELFKSLKLPKENVIVNFRGSHVLARTYLPPSTQPEVFERWFVESIETMIPGTPISEVVYSYDLLPSGRALIAFARIKEIEKLLSILNCCGITPVSIDASCLALYDSFRGHPLIQSRKNLAIVDINSTATYILLVKDGEPYVSAEIPLGGKTIGKGRDKYRNFANQLGSKIVKNFDYYTQKEEIRIERLLLTGDYACDTGMKKHLQNAVGIKTELADPFKYTSVEIPPNHDPGENHYYAQALGLAIKGFSPSKINLIPHETREKHKTGETFRRRVRTFRRSLLAVIPLAVGLIFLTLFFGSSNTHMSRNIRDLEAKKNLLSSLASEEVALNARIRKLNTLNRNRQNWAKLLYDIGRAVPEGLYFKELTTDDRLIPNGTSTLRKTRLVIEGSASDQKNMLELIKNLEPNYKDIFINNIKGEGSCDFQISLGI